MIDLFPEHSHYLEEQRIERNKQMLKHYLMYFGSVVLGFIMGFLLAELIYFGD